MRKGVELMKPYRRKYRGYWILIEGGEGYYTAKIWIAGHPEDKKEICSAFSAGLAEAYAESEINKTLSFGGVLG